MADIFLSYARADQQRVERLAAALEEAGYSVWWDKHLRSGHQFSKDIEAALTRSKAVLVVWSSDAIESEWVRDEAAIGRDLNKLVAARLGDILPPIGFRQRHAIDLGEPDAMASLTRALDALVGSSHDAVTLPPENSRKKSSKTLILGAAAAFAIILAGGTYLTRDSTDTLAENAEELGDRKSIAILPFRDLSGENQSWFSDGLAQEISAALSRTPDLEVAPTSESFRYRDRQKSLEVIGTELGVAHILDGSVRRSEDRIVVDIELIESASGTRLYSQRYDRPIADSITVQEDIATRIATALDTALDPEALAALIDSGTNNVDAWENVLRAGDLSLQEYDDYGLRRLNFQRQAIKLDPSWSRPYSDASQGIANMLSVARTSYDPTADRAALSAEADRYLDLAAELANSDKARLSADASRYFFRGEFRKMERASREYTKQHPDDQIGWGHLYQAQIQLQEKRNALTSLQRSLALAEHAADIPPERLTYFYRQAGADKEALEIFETALKENRTNSGLLLEGHTLLLANDRTDDARAILRQLEALGVSDESLAAPRFVQACADGNRAMAEQLLPLRKRLVSRWNALMYLGRTKEAEELLKPYDFAEPPFALLDMLFFPNFDPRPYPNLMKIVEREHIPIEDSIKFRTPACPAASRGA